VPLLADSLGTRFDAVLLKGRGNYLCINAWRSAQMTGGSIIGEREKSVSLPLVLWSEDTASGDIAENTAFRLFGPARGLWSKLSAEGQPCSPQVCRFYDQCFMIQARRRAQNTHLVVVNHSLLFSDLSSDGSVLGDYDALVIDEAHNLEKVASDYMGRQATYWGLRDLLRRLYAKDVMEVGLIARIAQEINRAKMGAETKKKCLTDIGRAIEQIGEAESSTSDLFEAMTSVLPSDSDGRGFEDRIRYTGSQAFAAVADQIAQLNSLLSALPDTMKTINDHLERMGDNLIPSKAEFAVDLASRAMDVAAWSETLVYLTQGDDPEWVFWYELPARSSRSKHVTLSCAPLHVGKHLDSILYSDMRTIIFTSATLAVADKFTHFVDRSGLNLSQVERVSTLSVGSPFDFDTQALVTVPGWMPSPKQSQPFQDAVDEFLAELLPKTRRGTMVLYTSYKMLNQSRAALREPLREAGTLLLAQGQDGSRSALAEQFKTDRSSVLLGTDSFWEGIDIPGDALEMLVIVKLPFAVPSDPMISAHLDELEKEGKNPFLYYTVPEAAIKFRQGFGRLIRNTQDRGVVVLLDSRVITARYG
ncbi:MAG: helicase C-terminal domain-containing protein, partial [Candidatus Latescibacteria bacterium]|nr:helicase C-terminal domain-containing protein [Candidatus Latescibacterota bacterium]